MFWEPMPSLQDMRTELMLSNNVTHWGTSPKLLTALKLSGSKRPDTLDSLRFLISSGSPLSSKVTWWFRDSFPSRVGLFSGSGGTDLVGGSKHFLDLLISARKLDFPQTTFG